MSEVLNILLAGAGSPVDLMSQLYAFCLLFGASPHPASFIPLLNTLPK